MAKNITILLMAICAVTPLSAQDRAHKLAKKAKTVHTNTCEGVDDSESCHSTYAEGCTTSTKQNTYDPYLAYLKNQTSFPKHVTPVKTLTSLADFQNFDQAIADLGIGKQQRTHAGQLADLGEGNLYKLIGYLYYSIPGGKETCNCKLGKPPDKDFHIGIGFDPQLATSIENGDVEPVSKPGQPPTKAEQTSVVIEMTPYYRAEYQPDWTLPRLQDAAGKQVKVIGQLLFDNEHGVPTEDCGLEGANKSSCWRGSAWELHPVIQFFVCQDATCSPDSDAGWVELKDYVVANP